MGYKYNPCSPCCDGCSINALVCASPNGYIYYLNPNDGSILQTLTVATGRYPSAITLTPFGLIYAVAYGGTNLLVYDCQGQLVGSELGPRIQNRAASAPVFSNYNKINNPRDYFLNAPDSSTSQRIKKSSPGFVTYYPPAESIGFFPYNDLLPLLAPAVNQSVDGTVVVGYGPYSSLRSPPTYFSGFNKDNGAVLWKGPLNHRRPIQLIEIGSSGGTSVMAIGLHPGVNYGSVSLQLIEVDSTGGNVIRNYTLLGAPFSNHFATTTYSDDGKYIAAIHLKTAKESSQFYTMTSPYAKDGSNLYALYKLNTSGSMVWRFGTNWSEPANTTRNNVVIGGLAVDPESGHVYVGHEQFPDGSGNVSKLDKDTGSTIWRIKLPDNHAVAGMDCGVIKTKQQVRIVQNLHQNLILTHNAVGVT